ncbi:MAG: hypothetical protein U0586_16970 [Candidatus Brocadiaceae bacterium]
MQKRFTGHDDGFTVLEIMLTITIIAIGLFTVMSMITIVAKGNKQSKSVKMYK